MISLYRTTPSSRIKCTHTIQQTSEKDSRSAIMSKTLVLSTIPNILTSNCVFLYFSITTTSAYNANATFTISSLSIKFETSKAFATSLQSLSFSFGTFGLSMSTIVASHCLCPFLLFPKSATTQYQNKIILSECYFLP